MLDSDVKYMQHALVLASRAENIGEVPVGAVLVDDSGIIAEGWNQVITSHDPTAHAEIVAIRAAGQQRQNYRLVNTRLYVTLEPCPMCVGAIIHARIDRLVFGAYDPKTGAIVSTSQLLDDPAHNHRVEYAGGILENQCGDLLKAFFKRRR